MNQKIPTRIKPWRQVLDFIIHLRWHYQVFILSGCYLLGGLYYAGNPEWPVFAVQFINVHLFLFGGATAYNSFWDKDKGRIGGLKHPPGMTKWMHPASLMLQFFGLLLALPLGYYYSGVYLISMIMFWLYSTPLAKWKGRPWLSMVAISVSTGVCAFLLGHFALGGSPDPWLLLPATGCSLILLSLYPVSQIFQMDEDLERGYHTFAITYGLQGIKRFFVAAFTTGIFIIGFTLRWVDDQIALIFLMVSGAAGILIALQLKQIKGVESDYERVMKMKYVTSFAFVLFITICLASGR
ncbi:MAG: UbiA family prenyltransferase [Balneolales bacterium]